MYLKTNKTRLCLDLAIWIFKLVQVLDMTEIFRKSFAKTAVYIDFVHDFAWWVSGSALCLRIKQTTVNKKYSVPK